MKDETGAKEKVNEKGLKKRWFVVSAIVLVLILISVGGEIYFTGEVVWEEEVTKDITPLRAVAVQWTSYSYEEDGEFKGITYEVFDLAMSRLGVEYEFELVPLSRALKMAEAGEADVVVSGTYTPEREAYIMFTPGQRAYGVGGVKPAAYLNLIEGAFIVRTVLKDSFIFESIDQIAHEGYRIGVSQEYAYTPAIRNANWNKVSHVTEQESMKALENGEIDMFLTYKEVGLAIRDEMGLHDDISIALGPAPFEEHQFILFSKNSDYPNLVELQALTDKELIKIHASGEYKEIHDKYVKE